MSWMLPLKRRDEVRVPSCPLVLMYTVVPLLLVAPEGGLPAFPLRASRCFLQADRFQVCPPRLPIIMEPAVGYALVVVLGDIDVHQIDASAGFRLAKENHQDRIGIGLLPPFCSPGLRDHLPGNDEKVFAPELPVEGSKRATRL